MMDSAGYFDLLGESVPQVQVSVRTFALLGLLSTFHLFIYLFISIFIYIYTHLHTSPHINKHI